MSIEQSQPRRSRRRAPARLPDARVIVGWVYCVRLAVAGFAFLSVLRVWPQAEPMVTLSAALILVLAGTATATSFWFTHLRQRAPDRNFLYVQAVLDTLLVTWIVYVSGGAESPVSPLYILVVWTAAILLPFVGGVLIALLASTLFVAAAIGSTGGAVSAGVLLQLLLFSGVALLTGYLGDRLRQTGTALDEAETRLNLLRLDTTEILDTIKTGILTVDGAGRLAYMNPAAAELLGLSLSEWRGRAVTPTLDGIAQGLGWVIDETSRRRAPIGRFETHDPGDGSFVLGVSTTLVERDGDGAPAVTAIFQNITEKVRMEQLSRRAERLEALAELGASLAHEIKNPLASIRSAAEQLAHPDIEGDDRHVLGGLVVRESTRVSRLLAEFLDFARVKLVEPEPVDFGAVVRNAVSVVRRHPDAEGRTIATDLPGADVDLRVSGAEDLLHRAVFNLVLNAAQWAGPGGEVRVALEVSRSDILPQLLGPREVVRLRVSDSGPGIEPGMEEEVFDPFVTHRTGGTGLGLALVQRAAEAHGGVVFVDAAPGGESSGAVFTLCLPRPPETHGGAGAPSDGARSLVEVGP